MGGMGKGEMENFKWRTRARVVAYVDLVMSIYLLMATIFCIFEVKLVKYEPPSSTVIIVLLALITGFNLWASLSLLSATEFGRDVDEALERARIWRNVTFTLVVTVVIFAIGSVVSVIYRVAVGDWGVDDDKVLIRLVVSVVGIFYWIWRGSFLFTVYKFMKELETGIPSGATAAGDFTSEINCCGVTWYSLMND